MSSKKTGLPNNKHGLGRGLGAFLPTRTAGASTADVQDIPLTHIQANTHQPRRVFEEDNLQALADSLKQYGLVQPIIVQRQENGEYSLIAGERRLRAAKMCGWKTISALVRTYEDQVSAEVALIENLQREDLNAIEEGCAYKALMNSFGLTQAEVAEKVGKSRAQIANMIRLLQLPEEVKEMVSNGVLSMGQVRPLLQLSGRQKQLAAAQVIVSRALSARQAETYVGNLNQSKEKKETGSADAFLESLQDRMKLHLGTKVAIHLARGKKSGKIEISFASEKEFERLMSLLTDAEEAASGSAISFPV